VQIADAESKKGGAPEWCGITLVACVTAAFLGTAINTSGLRLEMLEMRRDVDQLYKKIKPLIQRDATSGGVSIKVRRNPKLMENTLHQGMWPHCVVFLDQLF
jgi:hypothetical protein